MALNCYEWRLTIDEGPRQAFAHNALPPADQKAMMGLYEQLEHELDEAGYFHPPAKRPSMVRNLRVALGKARMTDQEVRTFRGVVTALSKGRGRVLAKLAAQKANEQNSK